ncbi:gastrula zinc finger protein XlCGF17.1-like [Nymphalis io]|uniref:gastrula zinc finger protein XlCGF17.1-like n=1 Tax=Inachis io TaxID=171585 RepID=UPI002166DC4E|nr:gastrula zinc finger protein XlCGF17.1-like [Nymphalis io]
MVGHLMLLKILHYKLHGKKRTRNNEKLEISNSSSETKVPFIKKEINYVDDMQTTCRVCLKEGDIPIYGNEIAEDISKDLCTFGEIEVSADDNYPKFICQACNVLLQNALLLRKTAQQSDKILRQPHENDNDDNLMRNDDFSCFEENGAKNQSSEYYCRKCDLNFNTFEEYSGHRLSDEHENMRQTCPICKNSYATLYFRRHMALHKVDTPYMCDICGKKFIVQGQFTRHRMTHFYNLPFECSLCPYRGRFKESLKMHMRSHTGEKPYQCSQCPARFVNKSNLNKHLLTHKGDHDFKCESCGRGFYTKRDLDLHFKVDHTGIKDHVCNICGKAFGYRKQMMKHQLKVHKREKFRSGRMPLYLQYESKKDLPE